MIVFFLLMTVIVLFTIFLITKIKNYGFIKKHNYKTLYKEIRKEIVKEKKYKILFAIIIVLGVIFIIFLIGAIFVFFVLLIFFLPLGVEGGLDEVVNWFELFFKINFFSFFLAIIICLIREINISTLAFNKLSNQNLINEQQVSVEDK